MAIKSCGKNTTLRKGSKSSTVAKSTGKYDRRRVCGSKSKKK